MASCMPADVEARIRALPGNDTCADCSNVGPQWASVTYGTLVCLECSGQHRSLGVHLSFVRSVQMDSWSEKQIAAMEKSGGNAKLVEFFKARGIEQSMPVAQKYGTKQAAYYRDRLSRWLEGKTEPPPDPGRYDPESGGDAQGAEPLPGETTEAYNARQQRLREAAKQRMREKFGEGGLSGIGSEPAPSAGDLDIGAAAGAAAEKATEAAKAVSGAVGGAMWGMGNFLKSNAEKATEAAKAVIENEELHSTVKGTVSGVTDTASSTWKSLRSSVADGELLGNLKKNVSAEEGSAVRKGWGWTLGAVSGGLTAATGFLEKAKEGVGNLVNDASGQEPCGVHKHPFTVSPLDDATCARCGVKGTRYCCSRGCEYYVCAKCFDKHMPEPETNQIRGGDGGEEETEEEAAPPPEVTADDIANLAKELGMSLGDSKPEPKAAQSAAAAEVKAAPAASAAEPAAAAAAPEPAAPKPKPKPKAKPLGEDDFFAEFDAM